MAQHSGKPAATLSTNADILGSETKPTADEEEKPTKKKKAEKRDDATETNITHQREQDESVNPAPFRFKPFQLAHMLDPKDLELLTKLGGTDGVIQGLGTHAKRGLATGGQVPQGAGRGVSQSRKQTESSQSVGGLPNNVILTEPSGNEGPPSDGDDHAPYTATMDDRKRVYGNNTLPTRISKTLLQLIFAAMKDKVLVSSGELLWHRISRCLSSTIRFCYPLRPLFLWLWVFSKILVLPGKMMNHLSTGSKVSRLWSLSQ